ncbi:MAG: DUF4251 domain-containing protein [Chlorobi bacterium]|nr:DUF4251 domain-containing protein [Chlorobiota bacterium]
MKIKVLIFGLLVAFAWNTIEAQTTLSKAQRKKERENAKAIKEKNEEAEWQLLKKKIEDKDFVFTGKTINGQSLDPKINFLYISDNDAVIQFANGFGGGLNGIGGITVKGVIDKYRVSAKKPGKAINVVITIRPNLGQGVRGPINFNLSAYSFGSASLGIDSNISMMLGEIRSYADSKIFVGNTLN